MARFLLVAAFIIGAAIPVLAAPGDSSNVGSRNWDVMLSQYPARAREAREQGPVGFRVTLDDDGYASECVVTGSSGYPRLDEETCRLIMTRGEFRGITDENGRRTRGVFEGVVNWRLPPLALASGAVTPEASPATDPAIQPAPIRIAQASSSQKLICRRKLRTGTLASFERTCLTQAEWDRAGDRIRGELREMRDKGHTNCRMAGAC